MVHVRLYARVRAAALRGRDAYAICGVMWGFACGFLLFARREKESAARAVRRSGVWTSVMIIDMARGARDGGGATLRRCDGLGPCTGDGGGRVSRCTLRVGLGARPTPSRECTAYTTMNERGTNFEVSVMRLAPFFMVQTTVLWISVVVPR